MNVVRWWIVTHLRAAFVISMLIHIAKLGQSEFLEQFLFISMTSGTLSGLPDSSPASAGILACALPRRLKRIAVKIERGRHLPRKGQSMWFVPGGEHGEGAPRDRRLHDGLPENHGRWVIARRHRTGHSTRRTPLEIQYAAVAYQDCPLRVRKSLASSPQLKIAGPQRFVQRPASH